MILVNFSHRLSEQDLDVVERLTGLKVEKEKNCPAQFDHSRPFEEQARVLVDSVGLSPADWEHKDILVNLPGFAAGAVAVLAELHGRMGHFPSVVRVRPVPDTTPTRFEVAEIINLQAVRDRTRAERRSAT